MDSLERLPCQICITLFGLVVFLFGINVIGAQSGQTLEPNQSYTLELPNGSILRQAVFRSQRENVYIFDVPGVGKSLALTDFRVIPEPAPRSWLVSAGISSALPLNQHDLGFQKSLGGDLQLVMQVFPQSVAWLPWLSVKTGFLHLDGERALLSGPDLSAGPAWLIPLGLSRRHFLYGDLTAGVAFYRLFNEKVERTYQQHTFISQSQIGYQFRLGNWGAQLSWAQQLVYDVHYPLVIGGLRLAAIFQR